MLSRICNIRLSVLAVFLLLALWGTTAGQSTTGSITGVVKDANGGVISKATVTATNEATTASQQTETNDEGIFIIPQLPPGRYKITVEKDGFKKTEKTDVILNALGKLNAGEFMLEIGTVVQTVTVMADTGQLQIKSESGERSDLISNTQIKDLALNGRNMLDLLKIIPGVVSTVDGTVSGPGGFGNFNINGTRGNQHELAIDGSSNVDTGSNGTQHVTLNPDAVAEVKVLTSNYQAEYGKAGGGFISYVTKSGGHDFHGTGRFFHRHEGLNANPFFNNAQRLDRPLYRYNYSGYDVGGPVYIPGLKFNEGKDKLFFFWNQEFYRQLVPDTPRNILVPSLLERQGDFSQSRDGNGNLVTIKDPLTGQAFPGNKIPQQRWFSHGQKILKLYPEPNVTGDNRSNYTSQLPHQYPRREDVIRIDYQLSKDTRIYGRFINNFDQQFLPYGTFQSGLNFPATRIVFPQPGVNGVLSISHTFGPTLFNEFIFGPSRNRLTLEAEDDGVSRTGTGIDFPVLFQNHNDYIPNFNYGGLSNIAGFPTTGFGGLPFRNVNHTFNFIDNLTKIWGAHNIKAGAFLQRSRKDQTSFGAINATINFQHNGANPLSTGHPYANALLGIYDSYVQANNFLTGLYRYWNMEFYVQDTWKVTSRLTLDYGIRFSWYEPQFEERQQTGVFNPSLYDRSKAVRLYAPVCLTSAACASGANRRAVDPAQLRPGFVPTPQNTLPPNFIGLIVPGSGDLANGIGQTSKGYPKGGFDDVGLLYGPRVGFAYDVFGDRKTVVRGGLGISYDRIQGNQAFDMITAPPAILTPRLFFGDLRDIHPAGSAGDLVLAPSSVFGYAKDGNIPTVYSFSLGVQRELPYNTVIDIGYVGSISHHLIQQRNLNAIPYLTTFQRSAQDGTRFAGSTTPSVEPGLPSAYSAAGFAFSGANALPVDFLRPYPGYGDITFREFVGSSNYHSLQVAVNRRFTKSLQFGIAYTWSKAMDTANTDTDFTNPYNTRGYDYRTASFDRTHNLVVNYVYDLPKVGRYLGDNWVVRGILDNWQLSGISQFITGTPLELGVTVSGVNAGQRITGSYTEGPRFLLRSNPFTDAGKDGMHIDPNAFVIPQIGFSGPWPRNYLRNPGFSNHDISIFKNFPFGGEGSRYIQLRFELFNAFNHTEFTGLNGGTTLAVPEQGAPRNYTTDATKVFNNYDKAVITSNVRGLDPTNDAKQRLGQFFGEYNGARSPRVIQLGVKVYF